jgi:hypothetical protein
VASLTAQLAADALSQHVAASYPFFGMADRPEASAFFAARERKALLDAERQAAFVAALVEWLALLRDVHVSVTTAQGTHPTVRGIQAQPNWDDGAIRAAVTDVLTDARGIAVARIGSGEVAVG